MHQSNFLQRKKSVLSKKDKSSKGNWDKRIIKLCDKINSLNNYYTSSSCSGRVVLMIDQNKKEEGLFLKVWHDLISFKELKGDLKVITSPPAHPKNVRALHSGLKKVVNNKEYLFRNFSDDNFSAECLGKARREAINDRAKQSNLIKFKQEPPILHVACKSIEDGFNVLRKARLIGWKRSGIISQGNRYVVELISTERLEFPIVKDNKVLVSDDFLKLIVKKSNENLKKGWKKIEGLRCKL